MNQTTENIDVLETSTAKKGKSLWKLALQRLLKNKAAVTSIVLLLTIVTLAVIAPWLSPYELDEVDWDNFQAMPNFDNKHYLGTDSNGRDLFVRILYGTRISLMVGLAATSVSLLIGVTYGALAGFIGGRIDNIMMRIVDVLYSLPFMFFVILLMVFFGRNIILMFAAIGAIEWLTMARIVRGQSISLRRKEFVEAAMALGVSTRGIISRHIVPNTLGTVIIYVTLTIPQVILTDF